MRHPTDEELLILRALDEGDSGSDEVRQAVSQNPSRNALFLRLSSLEEGLRESADAWLALHARRAAGCRVDAELVPISPKSHRPSKRFQGHYSTLVATGAILLLAGGFFILIRRDIRPSIAQSASQQAMALPGHAVGQAPAAREPGKMIEQASAAGTNGGLASGSSENRPSTLASENSLAWGDSQQATTALGGNSLRLSNREPMNRYFYVTLGSTVQTLQSFGESLTEQAISDTLDRILESAPPAEDFDRKRNWDPTGPLALNSQQEQFIREIRETANFLSKTLPRQATRPWIDLCCSMAGSEGGL